MNENKSPCIRLDEDVINWRLGFEAQHVCARRSQTQALIKLSFGDKVGSQ